MKILIGLRHGGGQLGFDISWDEEKLQAEFQAARDNNRTLDFTDAKGERALIPADSISYILVPAARDSRVGFARP